MLVDRQLLARTVDSLEERLAGIIELESFAYFAFHQIGGKQWEEYYTRMKKTLLAIQQSSGSWRDSREGGVGPAYQTAIAVLILSVPTDYLPIYQR